MNRIVNKIRSDHDAIRKRLEYNPLEGGYGKNPEHRYVDTQRAIDSISLQLELIHEDMAKHNLVGIICNKAQHLKQVFQDFRRKLGNIMEGLKLTNIMESLTRW